MLKNSEWPGYPPAAHCTNAAPSPLSCVPSIYWTEEAAAGKNYSGVALNYFQKSPIITCFSFYLKVLEYKSYSKKVF